MRPLFFLLSLLLGVGSNEAEAFNRKRTEQGVPVSWRRFPIPYVMDARGMGDYFRTHELRGAVGSEVAATELAFFTWQQARCGALKTRLAFLYQGLSSSATPGYDRNCSNCNTNLVIFHSTPGSWPFDKQLIVQTSLSYENSTGEIFDADIQVNVEHFPFSTQTDNEEHQFFDLQSVLTYAVGQFLGLENSDIPEATMAPTLGQKELGKRTLKPDDINGVCEIYPGEAITGVPTYQQVESFRALGCSHLPLSSLPWWLIFGLVFLGHLRLQRRKG
jgi:hypothetical protein